MMALFLGCGVNNTYYKSKDKSGNYPKVKGDNFSNL